MVSLPDSTANITQRVEEIHVEVRNVLFVNGTRAQGSALVVEGDVEGLGVGAELIALQVAPLVAHGAQRATGAVGLGDLDVLGQRGLVVDKERDEHVVLGEPVGHGGVGPHGGLHLAAVHAAEAREVDHHGLALGAGGGHAFLVVGVGGAHRLGL